MSREEIRSAPNLLADGDHDFAMSRVCYAMSHAASAARLARDWESDRDVLCLGIGKPREATGVDIGQTAVAWCDEKKKDVVGLPIPGMRARLVESLKAG